MQTGSSQLSVFYITDLSENVIVSTPESYKKASTWNKSVQAVNTKVLGNTVQFLTLKSKNSAEEKQFLSPWKQQ